MARAPVIEIKHVALQFGDLHVHRDISFSVYKGETVTLLGPSGVGKTLLLKMIVGLLRPTAGEVWVLGSNMAQLEEQTLRDKRKNIGMVFQGAALFDSLTVSENIAYALREAEETETKIEVAVKETLEIVGLPGIEHKFPGELSGGQKKRVGLARALASSPSIMLFDEPTTGLDPTAVKLIDDLILKLRNDYGLTSVVVTHDIESAKRISNRWVLINNGVVLSQGPVIELACKSEPVIDFISGNWNHESSK